MQGQQHLGETRRPMIPTQVPDSLLHSLPLFKTQSPGFWSNYHSFRLCTTASTLMMFCKMGLYYRPLGALLAVSFLHGAFKTQQPEKLGSRVV